MYRITASGLVSFIAMLAALEPLAANAASTLSLGPRAVQALVSEQLFVRRGRWYLIDDGACFTYLDSPRTHLEVDRLVLNARLTSRLGQRFGDNCVGADLASNVTLSGRLKGTDHALVLEDIRIDHVDDESTRSALGLALQLAPDALPHSVTIDVADVLRKQLTAGGSAMRLDQFHIVSVSVKSGGVLMSFDLGLSEP